MRPHYSAETGYDGGKRVPATMSAIADAVRWAEEIMKGRLISDGL